MRVLVTAATKYGATTEIAQAIAETLKRGRQVLILLPEIALTTAFLEHETGDSAAALAASPARPVKLR